MDSASLTYDIPFMFCFWDIQLEQIWKDVLDWTWQSRCGRCNMSFRRVTRDCIISVNDYSSDVLLANFIAAPLHTMSPSTSLGSPSFGYYNNTISWLMQGISLFSSAFKLSIYLDISPTEIYYTKSGHIWNTWQNDMSCYLACNTHGKPGSSGFGHRSLVWRRKWWSLEC